MYPIRFAVLGFLAVSVTAIPAQQTERGAPAEPEARPQAQQQRARRQRRPGFGKRVDTISKDFHGPSVVAGQPPALRDGSYPPDFQLEPVKLYPEFREWLGNKAPRRFEDKVMLSDLIGGQPVMLLFGSYT